MVRFKRGKAMMKKYIFMLLVCAANVTPIDARTYGRSSAQMLYAQQKELQKDLASLDRQKQDILAKQKRSKKDRQLLKSIESREKYLKQELRELSPGAEELEDPFVD